MTVRRHRRYSTEFKIQLVQAYLDGEGSARSIATRHEVPHSLLMVWIKKYEAGDLTREIHLQEEVVEYGAKIAALEQDRSADDGARRHEKKGVDTTLAARRAAVDHLRSRGVPIRRGCSLMNMARSTFYKRPHAGHRAAREKADTDLRVRIEDILAEFPAYGYRRVTHELRRRGLVINHKRVARVMREHALTPHRVRAWLATTNSDHKQPIYPNLRSSITPEGPDELWVADLTYIRLTTGFVFLAVVLDAWSRRVIGYAISHLLDTRLCLAALDAALDLRQPRAGLVHHSDRGVQYASRAYRSRLAAHGIRGSMSRRGNPYDNAHVESFFKTLKHEEIFANDYSTIDDLTNRLPHFLEEVYNRRRLHSSLGYRPPEEFESVYAA